MPVSDGARLPGPLRAEVEEALRLAVGSHAAVAQVRPVGGGCINPARRVVTEDGSEFFLKWNEDELPGLFEREADGLRALREAARETRIRVPEVVAVGGEGEGVRAGFLLLEHVGQGSPGESYGRDLGRGLATLHHRERVDAAATAGPPPRESPWGWERDNWIGSLPQSNPPHATWAEFWWEERIRPQWERAHDAGLLASAGDDRLLEGVRAALPALVEPAEEDGASLLHGDLWSGNVYPGPEGEPVLIDPAAYRGHREVDLAMAELFGGFPAEFLPAYREVWRLRPGYADGRRAAYQLYPLLVHVNLFGTGYVGRARAAAGTVARVG